ncbi:uncharacterized protein LOC143159756 [Aptenodytes patagonicus]|uniref:uncharacterized protein LOC143159756 n=1 Tax=Aptenodytes patagonicus TaxID=9234 RepID=UPI003FA039EB
MAGPRRSLAQRRRGCGCTEGGFGSGGAAGVASVRRQFQPAARGTCHWPKLSHSSPGVASPVLSGGEGSLDFATTPSKVASPEAVRSRGIPVHWPIRLAREGDARQLAGNSSRGGPYKHPDLPALACKWRKVLTDLQAHNNITKEWNMKKKASFVMIKGTH